MTPGQLTSNRKKQRERFLLERFFDASKLDAQIVEEREAPDFIVETSGVQVGVEVTEFFISHGAHANSAQAQEAISSRIAARAQHLYQSAGGPPAHVTVCFGSGQNLQALHRDQTAYILCECIRSLNLSLWQSVDLRREELKDLLPDEISFVHALGVPGYDMAHWGVARAGWAAPLTPLQLQERIDAKAKRLPKYEDAITENWLLIVADTTKPSSLVRAGPSLNSHAILSPFARTYFYGYPDSFLELGARSGVSTINK